MSHSDQRAFLRELSFFRRHVGDEMQRSDRGSALSKGALILLVTVVALGGNARGEGSQPAQGGGASSQAGEKPPAGKPATIPPPIVAAAQKIANDPQVLALVKDQSTDAAAKARWNQ